MIADPSILAVLAAAFIAATVGGFSGFGAGLVIIPPTSAILGPTVAAAVVLVVGSTLMLPLVVRSLPLCRWKAILPAAATATVSTPAGAWVLATGDPVAVRWGLCVLVLALLALLVSPLRYRGEPPVAASLAVGGLSGVLNGIGQIAGPPIIVFWMNGPHPPQVLRANFIVYFSIISVSSILAYAWNGLFTAEVMWLALLMAPAYALGIYVGSRLFPLASPVTYRRLAYAIIALSALISVPALDPIFR